MAVRLTSSIILENSRSQVLPLRSTDDKLELTIIERGRIPN